MSGLLLCHHSFSEPCFDFVSPLWFQSEKVMDISGASVKFSAQHAYNFDIPVTAELLHFLEHKTFSVQVSE